MKNAINYYYNLNIDDIHQIGENYNFNNQNSYYRLIKIEDIDVNKVYSLNIKLLNMGIYNHQIILTKDSIPIMQLNGKNYVLYKLYDEMNNKVTLEDVIKFTNINVDNIKDIELRSDNWGELWSNKIDYFEYQMSQFGIKYPIINESINYYIGLAEMGISLFNNYKNDTKLTLSHKRVKIEHTMFELYDPFNFVFDIKVRDISEYFKSLFLKEGDIFDKIENYLNNNNLTSYELLMFFIRMLYPSFYFDLYEEIVNNELDDNIIETAIKKTDVYEHLLGEIYNYLSHKIIMPDINWLKKYSY